MGWCLSPPNFSACTETVADLANASLEIPSKQATARTTPHRLDTISETALLDIPPITTANIPSIPCTSPFKKLLRYWDFYMDDFCGLVQGNIWTRRWVKRILLRLLDPVFRPIGNHDNAFRQEPASIKKMKQGDATWTTSTVILGWLIDTTAKTISLSPHRIDCLREILDSIAPDQKTIATKDWHKVLGELPSMSIALPGSVGLFSLLQEAFRCEDQTRPHLNLSKSLHRFLKDFCWLATDVAT